jgi:nicotinamide-nucleotide amidase
MGATEAVVMAVGEEVLRGEVVNSNAAWLGRRLSALGFRVAAGLVVADREADIVAALGQAARASPVTVVSGGLGPTGDDLTAGAAAQLLGAALVESPEARRNIAERLRCPLSEVTGSRLRMAMVPEGAEVYPNPAGSAPGIHLRVRGTGCGMRNADGDTSADVRHLFLLPGVPREMMAIFDGSVATALERLFPEREACRARLLHLAAWPESRADQAGRAAVADLLGPGRLEFGTKLGGGMVSLRVAAEGPGATELVDEAARRLRARFGEALWGQGEESLEGVTVRTLLAGGLRLALAESCTGGLVAARLVSVPGASGTLLESLVTYSNESKTRLLGVPPDLLERHGAVSRECAEAMASGLRARSGADITLAVTGIAGPDGGTPEKPVGTVHFAVCSGSGPLHDVQSFGGVRDWVRERAAGHALWLVLRAAGGPVQAG